MGPTVAKRTFDIAAAAVGILVTSPVLVLAALATKIDSPGPALHGSTRVGRGGRHFSLLKLRATRADQEEGGAPRTVADHPTITRVGRLWRRSRLDELPQLINVLKGDMSLVGPRPEDPRHVAEYTPGQRRVLSVKPGLTSPASIAYRHEEALLMGPEGEPECISAVLPKRLAMDLEYVWSRSFWADLKIVFRTVLNLLRDVEIFATAGRLVPWWMIDGPVVFACFYLVFYLRYLDTPNPGAVDPLPMLAVRLVPVVILYVVVNHLTRLHARVWRYATASEVLAVGKSWGISTVVVIVADSAAGWGRARPLPLGGVAVGACLTLSAFVVVRYRSRLLTSSRRKHQINSNRPAWAARTLIYGAGEAGQLLAWRLLTLTEGQRYEVVGFVDDDRQKLGHTIHGIQVVGTRDDLCRLVPSHNVDLIVIAVNNISGEEMRAVVTTAQQSSARIRIVPDLFGWMSDSIATPLREVQPEDLLGRKPVMGNNPATREVVSGRSVLVTGAAGSIGSELCRQLGALQPARLIALDANESGLFDLATELRVAQPQLDLATVLADITGEKRIRRIFEDFHPDVVFHVAAYKHVPLIEEFPEEAARVNVLGTWNVLTASRDVGSGRFVLVSSDKAVNPSSIMGASKRIAERLVSSEPACSRRRRSQPTTMCAAVRFGNVLGSRGSVVPTFTKQIEMGGPVTITDPGMTRYFMDVSEAADLIIQAAALTAGRDLFMLDMGDEIRIDDLARKMIRMRGLRPGVDIDIVYTGVRPGEKLQEELYDQMENLAPTSHPRIYKLTGNGHLSRQEALRTVAEIRSVLGSRRRNVSQLIRDVMHCPAGDVAALTPTAPAAV